VARRINLSQIGGYAEEKMEKLLREVVFETETRLKLGSPVDTGRFRGSWVLGENQASAYDAGEYQPATGKYRGQTQPPASPALEKRVSIGYQAGQEKIGNVYHISNSLPYAYRLAYEDWSTQAPAGWVDLIGREMQAYAKQQADRIGRQD
jgi:hypothetical protein